MGVFFLYASFPNSRIKPRPSTSQAQTYQVAINGLPPGGALTQIVEATLNRTYVLIKNLSADSIWYVYAAPSVINPSVVPVFGNPDQLIYYSPTNQLYQKQDDGVTNNWTAVQIENVGEDIEPLQTATLESPENYWASTSTVNPGLVAIDKGSG